MFELRYIHPANLHSAWDVVADGIAKCLESEDEDARVEDVYAAIKANLATLHLGYLNGAYIGFAVLQSPSDPYSNTPRLHIWFLEGIKTVLVPFFTELQKMAHSLGADRITFQSPRSGFGRLLKDEGFEEVQILYLKRV